MCDYMKTQELSENIQGFFNLTLIHVLSLNHCTICSVWGQSASERMKHHRGPSPTSYIDNLPHNPPLTSTCCLWYKNRWDSHQCLCIYASTPPIYHLLFDELPDDPGHLVSVHLHHRLGHFDAFVCICQQYITKGSSKSSFSFTTKC